MNATPIARARRRDAAQIARKMWAVARHPAHAYDGRHAPPAVCQRTVAAVTEPEARVSLLFTFDYGHHSSGWWKNSAYEYCFHLSATLIERPRLVLLPGEADGPRLTALPRAELDAWADAFFGPETHRLWLEPGYKIRAVTHLRLFVDIDGHPITPQGEVYHLIPFQDGSSPEKVFGRMGAD